jgi:hypothetical protein
MNYYISLTGKTSIPSLPDKDKDISAAFECLRLKKIIENPSDDEITYQYESVSTATLLDGKTAIKGKSTGKQSVKLRMVLIDEARALGLNEEDYYRQEMSKIIEERLVRNL